MYLFVLLAFFFLLATRK